MVKEHPTAVKISFLGSNLITQKELLAEVARGEAAIFAEKNISFAQFWRYRFTVTCSYTR